MRLIAVFLFFFICTAAALSVSEEKAIKDLLTAFPDLGSLSPPWTSNASEACIYPPFKGITCSDSPKNNVIKLYELFF